MKDVDQWGLGEDGMVLYLHLFFESGNVGLFQACLVQVLFVFLARFVLAVHDEDILQFAGLLVREVLNQFVVVSVARVGLDALDGGAHFVLDAEDGNFLVAT